MLGHQAGAVEDGLEVALRESLPLRDHAEAVRPAASAARACSRIWSAVIIACIGVSASANRDWAQKPQSSAQPPDFALTSEHMSVESSKRSSRTRQARSTSASISAWSSIRPSRCASSWVMSGGTIGRHARRRVGRSGAPHDGCQAWFERLFGLFVGRIEEIAGGGLPWNTLIAVLAVGHRHQSASIRSRYMWSPA